MHYGEECEKARGEEKPLVTGEAVSIRFTQAAGGDDLGGEKGQLRREAALVFHKARRKCTLTKGGRGASPMAVGCYNWFLLTQLQLYVFSFKNKAMVF